MVTESWSNVLLGYVRKNIRRFYVLDFQHYSHLKWCSCKTEPLATGLHQLWHTWITRIYAFLVIGLHNHQTSISLRICRQYWKKNIWKHHPILKDYLWQVAQEEWYAIHNDYITSLYESLPMRLHDVLRNKGLNTKY